MSQVKVPADPIRVCVVNEVGQAGVTFTPTSQATNSPATNLSRPGRPFLPWRTTAGGDQAVVVDFQTAKTLTGLWLVRTNFTTVTIQGNSSSSWGAPPFSQTYTIGQCPFNYRYQLAVLLSGFSYRYLRILIPSQTPVDGTSAYLLGGVFAGQVEVVPPMILYDVTITAFEPRLDIVGAYGQFRQRLIMGEALAQLQASLVPRTTLLVPGYRDDFATWQLLNNRISHNDFVAILMNSIDTTQGFMMRSVDQVKFTRPSRRRAQAQWNLEEVVGP